MKLRFRAHVNISRATFRPEALNSTSIGGFFVHRDFENVEQIQQVRPVEEPSRRVAPPRPTKKRPKERELGKDGERAREEMAGEEGSKVAGKGKGKVEAKKMGREGEKKKKKEEGKKNEMGKGAKGSEGAIGGEAVKREENGIVKIGKKEGKKKAKGDDVGRAMRKEVDGKKGRVSGEGDKGLEMGASGEELSEAGNPIFSMMGDRERKEKNKGAAPKPPVKIVKKDKELSEAGNPIFATMGDKKERERNKGAVAKAPAKSTKKNKEFTEAGNAIFATMGDKKEKGGSKGAVAKTPDKSAKKDKGDFSEAGNPLFAAMGGKGNDRGAEAKIPAKQTKKEEGKRIFMRRKKEVEMAPKVEVVSPKPKKLPPIDTNAPSARNPLLQYKERPNSGQLQVKTSLQATNDADSGDEFDA